MRIQMSAPVDTQALAEAPGKLAAGLSVAAYTRSARR